VWLRPAVSCRSFGDAGRSAIWITHLSAKLTNVKTQPKYEVTMETVHPRSSWEQLGDKWYRRIQHYTQVFDPDLDLDNYIIAGAPYGGAIGMSGLGNETDRASAGWASVGTG
jgi:hypothetical protein